MRCYTFEGLPGRGARGESAHELTQLAEQGQSGNVDTKTLKEKLSKAPTSVTGSGSGSDSNNGGSKTGLILGIIAGVVLIGVTIWAIVTRKKED